MTKGNTPHTLQYFQLNEIPQKCVSFLFNFLKKSANFNVIENNQEAILSNFHQTIFFIIKPNFNHLKLVCLWNINKNKSKFVYI